MADPTSTSDAVRSRPESPAVTPSSLYDVSAQLMGESALLSERRARRLETGAAETEKEASDLAALARQQETERAAARPAKPETKAPPSTAARAFLAPGTTVLGQMQTVMQGIGVLALGMAGAKGRGYAVAATEAMKGAYEGWAAGDAERVRRSLAEWQTQHQKLMDDYQLERDQFNDLLTNQKLSMSERFQQIRMRADVMGLKDLADQARQEQLTGVLNYLQNMDKSQRENRKVDAEILHWKAEQDRFWLTREDSERRFQERAAQSERHFQETSKRLEGTQAVVQVKPLLAYNQALVDFEKVRQGLRSMNARGLLPKDGTLTQQWIGTLKQKLEPGDPALALVRYLENPLTIGFFDRTLYDEKGARALQIFQKQLTGLEPMPLATAENLINELEDSMANRRRAVVGVLETAIRTPVMQETLGSLNRDWNSALELTPLGSDTGWGVERPK